MIKFSTIVCPLVNKMSVAICFLDDHRFLFIWLKWQTIWRFLLIWFQSPAFSKALNCKSFQNLKLRKMSNWIVFQQIINYIRSHGLLDSWFNTYTVMAQIFKSFILLSLVSWHLNVQLHLRYLSWFLNKHCQGKNWWEGWGNADLLRSTIQTQVHLIYVLVY